MLDRNTEQRADSLASSICLVLINSFFSVGLRLRGVWPLTLEMRKV